MPFGKKERSSVRLVKRSRHHLFTVGTGVRFSHRTFQLRITLTVYSWFSVPAEKYWRKPWKVIDDLKWFAQTDFLADAIAVFEKHRDEQILDEWLKTHDGEDYCKYCPENAECPHGMACYGGEPIEPSCYGADMKEFLYTDSIIEDALEERYGEE